MNDLLPLVKGDVEAVATVRTGDVEMGNTAADKKPTAANGDAPLQQFFALVATVKGRLAEINQLQKKLRDAHERSKTLTHAEDIRAVRGEMQDTTGQVKMVLLAIKRDIANLEVMNAQAAELPECRPGTTEERMRTSVTVGLNKKLKESMDNFQKLRTSINNEYRDVIGRRIYVVTGQHASNDDLDTLVNTGEAEGLFSQVLLEQGRVKVEDLAAEIRERHAAAKGLEAQLLALQDMFSDMAVLVDQQGEMLDNIEVQVYRATDYLHHGARVLGQAQQYRRNTRKWMICCVVLVIIILIIVACAIAIPIATSTKSG